MEKKSKYAMLIGLGAAVASLPVRAALYKPEKIECDPLPEEKVDLDRFRRNLSDAIKIRTVAADRAEDTDWSAFDAFHDFLRERYPLIHGKLERQTFARGSLMFRWKGSDASLDPIALLAHQDVVPVSEGTEQDWVHPAFDGVQKFFFWRTR